MNLLSQGILKKKCQISLVIEDDGLGRSIVEVLKIKGYVNIHLFNSIKAFLDKNITDENQWIIIAIDEKNAAKAISFLRSGISARRQAKVSFLAGLENLHWVAKGFKIGLVNYFPIENATFSKENFLNQLNQFFNRIQQIGKEEIDEAFLAASYYRRSLVYLKDWKSLIELELDLCHHFSLRPETLVHLAEAYFQAGMGHQARITIQKISQFQNPKLATHLARLEARYPCYIGPTTADKLNINYVVVIESDDSEFRKIQDALAGIGVDRYSRFSNYLEAWNEMENGEVPDALICQWVNNSRRFGVEKFIQLLRYQSGYRIPIILLTSSLTAADHQLMADVRILHTVSKPIRQHNFLMTLVYALEQHRRPTEPKSLEIKIEQLLVDGDNPYIQFLRKKFLTDKRIDPKRKFYIESFLYYQKHDYESARKLLMRGIRLAPKKSNLNIMENLDKKRLLSSCLLHLGDIDSAIKLLEVIHKASPRNIEYGVDLAMLLYDAGEKESSHDVINTLEFVDPNHPRIISYKTQIAVYEGMSDQAIELMKTSANIVDTIAAINSQAVKKIKEGSYELGFRIYKVLINAIPDQATEYKGTVYFNLGLAYLKRDMVGEAEGAIRLASTFVGSKVSKKASLMLKKMQLMQSQGKPLSSMFQESEEQVKEMKEYHFFLFGVLDQVQHRSKSILYDESKLKGKSRSDQAS